MPSAVPVTYFGMTLESLDYNFGYYGGPVEAWPAMPVSVVRSWDVWSPGNGQIEYLDWSDLNPSAGVYNWTALNAWIATNQANNAQMVYTFGDPPTWAGGTTTNLADFQAFVTAIVTQANGAIKYWEGFNEFDVSGIAPALLVQLQQIIYNTVHTLDPGALVLSPTVCAAGDDPLFAQFLADGGGKYFDIAAFHGYNNSTGEGLIPVVQDFQAILSQYGLANVPIWDTEWGMEAPTVITDITAQEAYVSTGLILQAALGVQTEMFYAYDNANSSLYNEATGQLTAAGVAYQQTEQWLLGATESGYQLNGSVYTVQLAKNGQTDLIVWNAAGQSSFSAGPYTQYLDTQGQLHSVVNGVVTIGTVPILLETPSTPAAPVITSDTLNGNSSVTLTGTAEANSTVTVYDGQTALGTTIADASGAWSYATGTLTSGTQVFTATATNIAGITSAPSNAMDPIIGQVPTVASVATSGTGITNGNGDLTVGSVVTLTLTMSEVVTVAGGTPTLTLNDGGTATYTGGSGSTALTFSYTVVASENTPDLTVSAVNLNGATITDGAGNSASLSGTLSPAGTLQIDTTAPTVASVATSGTGITNGNGDLTVGSVVTLTLTMSEAVMVSGGTPTLTLNDGGTATYTGGSGSSTAMNFSYTVASGQNTPDLTVNTVNLNGATITDGAGNNASLSGTLSPAGTLQIDTTPPTVTKVTAAPTAGDVEAGATVTITLTTSEVVNVTGTPALALNDGGAATYLSGSGTNTLVFGYTVAAGQNTTSLQLTGGVSGGSITDAAGNAAVIAPTGLGRQINVDQWNRAISANWQTTADWSSGIPRSYDLVALNAAGKRYTVTSTANETIAELNTVATATLAISSGTFNVTGGTGTGVEAGTISIASGATLNIAGSFNNTGTLLVSGGKLNVNGVLAGGMSQIGGAGKMVIAQASTENVTFLAKSTGGLVLDQATAYTGRISGFGKTQSIDLMNINFAAGVEMSYAPTSGANTSGTLTVSDGTHTAELEFQGTYSLANFKVASDGNGGTLVTDPTVVMQKPGNAPAIIANNTVVEIDTPDSGYAKFSGTTGTLWLDQPSTFTGKIYGFGAENAIDLPGIAFDAQTTLGYSPNSKNTGGTLSITDGTHGASLALLGNYMASSFVMESDNHGGTVVVAAASHIGQSLLANPQH